MARLEAVLEQRGIATPRELSEAIARCQLHGGDLTTSLLQFVNADEAELSAVLSECYGLPAAPVGLLSAPDDAASRSLPRDVAERYCCFPLAASPGQLVLAVARPLDAALKDELGLTLGVSIEERVALEVRIRQALARFYGLPLSPRNQRGVARLEGDLEGAGHETPLGLWSDTQLSALPRPPSGEPLSLRDSQRPPSVRPRTRNETPRFGFSTPPASLERPARRRGPLSLQSARDELARAGSRNEVLDIFFAFASQQFEYSALFAVHSSLAEGLDAWGKGADREAVLGIGVPLDLPSSLSEAAESCKVRLTRLGKEGIDRTLMVDLQRQHNNKALVLPVSLRGRCAVLLYADNGEADVLEREIADLVTLAPDAANALGRIILQRKKDAARQKNSEPGELDSLPPRRPLAPGGERTAPPPSAPDAGSLLEGVTPLRRSDDGSLQPLLAVSSNGAASSRARQSAPAAVRAATPLPPSSADDPVFLLARPHSKSGSDAPSSVAKPRVSITHPARIIGNQPRLPSVIVDPESADPEASERATRAAAITRAPTQMRSSIPGRRPAVPPAAEVPRTVTLTRDDEARSAAAATTIPAGRSRHLEEDRAPRLAESGVVSAEPFGFAAESQEAFGATGHAWPPPIMDNSPPPRQPPLTALVPIIIADPPKGRRIYGGAARGNAARGPQRPASNPAPGPAAATLPSPARTRRGEAAVGSASAPRSVQVATRAEPSQPPPAARETDAAASARSAAGAKPSDMAVAVATPARLHAAAPGSANGVLHSPDPAGLVGPASAPASSSTPTSGSPSIPPLSAGARPVSTLVGRPAAEALGASAPAPVSGVTASTPTIPAGARPPTTLVGRPAIAAPAVASEPAAATPATAAPATAALAGAAAVSAAPISAVTSAPAGTPTIPAGPRPISTLVGRPAVEATAPLASGTVPRSASEARVATSRSAARSAPSNKKPSEPPQSIAQALLAARPAQPAASSASAGNPSAPLASGTPAASGESAPGASPAGAAPSPPSTHVPAAASSPAAAAPSPAASSASGPRSAPLPAVVAESAAVPRSAALAGPSSGAASPGPRLAFAPPGSPSIPNAAGSLPARLEPSSALAGAPTLINADARAAVTIPARPPKAGDSIAPSVTIAVAGSAPEPRAKPAPVAATPSSPSAAPTSSPTSAPLGSRAGAAAPTNPPASVEPGSTAAPAHSIAPSSTATPTGSVAPSSSAAPAGSTTPTSAANDAPPGAERRAIFPPAPPDADIEQLVERVCQGNLTAVHELARIGAHSLPQVMARFPGPVISERAGPSSRASECGPLLQALAAIGSPAMPSITRSSENDDARVRRWATLLLGEMPGPEACRAVVQRLADDVPRVHQAALDAARLLLASPAADLFRATLFEVAEAEEAPLTLRLRTLEHVAKLKDSASVPRLIAFLGADLEPIVHKALWALTVVTRHDYGRDGRAWAEFWQKHQARHRVEWLIEALDEHDIRLRKAAADELREETGELYGYTEDLPEPERHAIQQKFRDWWRENGSARHTRG